VDKITLRNGIKIPQVGLGTWQLTDRKLLKQIISRAYEEGYRLIDTAAAYSNEIAISKAISESGISRREWVFVIRCGTQAEDIMRFRMPVESRSKN